MQELTLGHAVEQPREDDSAAHGKQPAQERDRTAFDEKQGHDRARSCAERADYSDLTGALQHAETDRCDQRDRADERGRERDYFHYARHHREMFLERSAELALGVDEARRQPRIEERLLQRPGDELGPIALSLHAQERRCIAQAGHVFEDGESCVDDRRSDLFHDASHTHRGLALAELEDDLSVDDTQLSAGVLYEYRIQAIDETGRSSEYYYNFATTVIFGADLLPGQLIDGDHIRDLRDAVDAWGTFAGMAQVYSPNPVPVGEIKAAHFITNYDSDPLPGVLTALAPALYAIGWPVVIYGGVPMPAPGVGVSIEHVNQLREVLE